MPKQRTRNQKRHRETKTRKALRLLFGTECRPMSIAEISDQLASSGISPNKSTLYREINFFLSEGVVRELSFPSGKKYENDKSHHHHLICLNCEKATPVMINDRYTREEIKLGSKSGFKILRHELLFYGFCQKCK